MKIQVFIKNVYGNQLVYPKCKIAKSFSDIAKTKTLSKEVLKSLTDIGYQVELVSNTNIKELLKWNTI